MPVEHNLTLYQGDTYTATIIFQDGNTPIPVDPNGWKAQIRVTPMARLVTAEFTIDASDAANGRIKLTLDKDKAEKLVTRSCYDLEQTLNGIRTTHLFGEISVIREVTK